MAQVHRGSKGHRLTNCTHREVPAINREAGLMEQAMWGASSSPQDKQQHPGGRGIGRRTFISKNSLELRSPDIYALSATSQGERHPQNLEAERARRRGLGKPGSCLRQ